MKEKKSLGRSGVQTPRTKKVHGGGGIREEAIEGATSAHALPGGAETTKPADQTDFPIVGIGASAGGLEAFG